MRTVKSMEDAIHWAMENDIDILSGSHQAIEDQYLKEFDAVVNEAVKQGIIFTFINYKNPNNIPYFSMSSTAVVTAGFVAMMKYLKTAK